jgi:hypothetical protein
MLKLTLIAFLIALALPSILSMTITDSDSELGAYDPNLGYNLCRLTVASYCNPAKVKNWTCQACLSSPIKLSNVTPFHNSTGDVLGIIGTSDSPKGICISPVT